MEEDNAFKKLGIFLIVFIAAGTAGSAIDLWSRDINTNTTYPTNFNDLVNVSSFKINNKNVCLVDGTNCPAITGNFSGLVNATEAANNATQALLIQNTITKESSNNATQALLIQNAIDTELNDNITQNAAIAALVPTIVSIMGTGSGTDYTTTSATYLDVINYTTTVPLGSKAMITIYFQGYSSGGSHFESVAITNGTTIMTENRQTWNIVSGGALPLSLGTVWNGTGTQQTFRFRFHNNGAGTTGIVNNRNSTPVMNILIARSN